MLGCVNLGLPQSFNPASQAKFAKSSQPPDFLSKSLLRRPRTSAKNRQAAVLHEPCQARGRKRSPSAGSDHLAPGVSYPPFGSVPAHYPGCCAWRHTLATSSQTQHLVALDEMPRDGLPARWPTALERSSAAERLPPSKAEQRKAIPMGFTVTVPWGLWRLGLC